MNISKTDLKITYKQLSIDLIKEGKEDLLNQLICEKLNKHDRLKYAIYAAELVLHKFEDKYPDDKRPRIAIEAAKEYLKRSNDTYAYAAEAAFSAADNAAANSTYATAYSAANAAANAAYSAANAANTAYATATEATYAADSAAYAATYAAYAADDLTLSDTAKNKTYKEILNYGISLLETEES